MSTKTPVHSVQFLYETENTISLSLTKSRNCKGKLPLLLQEKQIPFFRTLSQISRLRLLTGKLETPDLGKKENAGSLAKFSTFTHMKGSVQERPGESIIFTEIGCFLSLFSVKRRKGLPCPLGENTVYYFVKYLYTGVACPV
ncbi:MAG: hypothetical protein ACLR1T_11285 [Evtepia gabavorous]